MLKIALMLIPTLMLMLTLMLAPKIAPKKLSGGKHAVFIRAEADGRREGEAVPLRNPP